MSRQRSIVGAVVLVTIGALVSAATAFAEYRGTDMWSNIMPSGGPDGLVNRYPISNYQLDYHVDGVGVGLGGVETSGIPANIAQFMSSAMFFAGVILMRCVIAVFDWSNNIDLVTGNNGGLSRSAPVVQHNYATLVAPFLTVAVICLGVWVAYKTVKRDRTDVLSTLGRALVLVVVAVAIVNQPQDTIGRLYQMGDDVAMIMINGGDGSSAADRMFDTFIYRPHAVLQHGGLEVCTGVRHDSDGFPLAATTDNPARECHSTLKRDPDGHGNYEAIMLRYAPGSDDRKGYYDALREGKDFNGAPNAVIDKTDAPAVDMMQAGGALQRLVFVLLILLGMAGGILLLGLIVIARMFSQVALLVLYFASPFVIIAAIYPGAHGLALKYLSLVGKVLVSAVFFAFLLSITLNTSRGLVATATAADPATGYGLAFGLQALLFLGVFFKRKVIIEKATSAKAVRHLTESENKVTSFVANATAASAGAVAGGAGGFATTMREGWKVSHPKSSGETSEAPDSTTTPAPDHQQAPAPSNDVDSSVASSTDVPTTTSATIQPPAPSGAPTQEDDVPTKTFAEELNDARSRNYDQGATPQPGVRSEDGAARDPAPPVVASPASSSLARPATPPPQINGIASASSFSWDLEDERHERELERRE